MKNKNINIINLGCRLNIYEGEVIKNLTEQNDLKNYTIINSCSVTEEAEKKVQYEIRKNKRKFPKKKIVVTGCAAQINPKKYSDLHEVDFVIGNKEKLEKKTWVSLSQNNPVQVKDIFSDNKLHNNIVEKFEGKSRAYIEIQQGCDHRCTFCIIPFGRGPNRSVSTQSIINSIRSLLDTGVKEIVLTGVDMTSWGNDIFGQPSLGMLVKKILKNLPDLPRLRLSSIDPAEVDFELMDVLEHEKRLMPHIHLSIQHGADVILKRMKRRHLYRDVINFVNEARRRRSDVVFGADFIAGFPTEDQNAHMKSLKLINEAGITYVHVFPYSDREGTPATKMPKVLKEDIKKRASELRQLGESQYKNFLLKQIGTKQNILIEKNGSGYSPNFLKTYFNEATNAGEIVSAEIIGSNSKGLIGKAT